MEILEINNCSNNNFSMTINFSYRKYNSTTQLINAIMKVPFDIDESVAV